MAVTHGIPKFKTVIETEPVDMSVEPWITEAVFDRGVLSPSILRFEWPISHYIADGHIARIRPVVGMTVAPGKWAYPYEFTMRAGHKRFYLADKPLTEVA